MIVRACGTQCHFLQGAKRKAPSDGAEAPARKRAATAATGAGGAGDIGGLTAEEWKDENRVKKLTVPVLKEYLAVRRIRSLWLMLLYRSLLTTDICSLSVGQEGSDQQ